MDIDIDTPTNFDPRTIFKGIVPASVANNDKISKHPAGVYFQKIPQEPTMGISSIPFNIAPTFGLFKVDMLHLSLLDMVQSKQQLREMIDREPDWDMLLDDDIIDQLFQLKNHGDTLKYIQPRDVQTLADCVALIRPGRRYLKDIYLQEPEYARSELYKLPLPKGCFKKAHAIAYALNIVVQLHTIKQYKEGFCEY